MTHIASCIEDTDNNVYDVEVDGKIVTSYQYTSWFNPTGISNITAQGLAFELTQNLTTLFNQNPTAYKVDVVQDGLALAFVVKVNDAVVTSYTYGAWTMGSQPAAKAAAYALAQMLNTILNGNMSVHQ
jgi:hypothetical protein